MEWLLDNSYTYLVLPLLIILARIVDVSIGTIKIILIAKGNKTIAPILGFFEVLVWLLAVTRIFENLDNWVCYIAYAFGFALGSFIGIKIEEKLAIGVQIIRVITRKEASELIKVLRGKGFGVTSLEAEGSQGKVGILYSIVNRKSITEIVRIIKDYNPNAFYTIEDIRFVSQQIGNNSTRNNTRRWRFLYDRSK
jgi:uncharacterized protein YebE (UPF0316 family)